MPAAYQLQEFRLRCALIREKTTDENLCFSQSKVINTTVTIKPQQLLVSSVGPNANRSNEPIYYLLVPRQSNGCLKLRLGSLDGHIKCEFRCEIFYNINDSFVGVRVYKPDFIQEIHLTFKFENECSQACRFFRDVGIPMTPKKPFQGLPASQKRPSSAISSFAMSSSTRSFSPEWPSAARQMYHERASPALSTHYAPQRGVVRSTPFNIHTDGYRSSTSLSQSAGSSRAPPRGPGHFQITKRPHPGLSKSDRPFAPSPTSQFVSRPASRVAMQPDLSQSQSPILSQHFPSQDFDSPANDVFSPEESYFLRRPCSTAEWREELPPPRELPFQRLSSSRSAEPRALDPDHDQRPAFPPRLGRKRKNTEDEISEHQPLEPADSGAEMPAGDDNKAAKGTRTNNKKGPDDAESGQPKKKGRNTAKKAVPTTPATTSKTPSRSFKRKVVPRPASTSKDAPSIALNGDNSLAHDRVGEGNNNNTKSMRVARASPKDDGPEGAAVSVPRPPVLKSPDTTTLMSPPSEHTQTSPACRTDISSETVISHNEAPNSGQKSRRATVVLMMDNGTQTNDSRPYSGVSEKRALAAVVKLMSDVDYLHNASYRRLDEYAGPDRQAYQAQVVHELYEEVIKLCQSAIDCHGPWVADLLPYNLIIEKYATEGYEGFI